VTKPSQTICSLSKVLQTNLLSSIKHFQMMILLSTSSIALDRNIVILQPQFVLVSVLSLLRNFAVTYWPMTTTFIVNPKWIYKYQLPTLHNVIPKIMVFFQHHHMANHLISIHLMVLATNLSRCVDSTHVEIDHHRVVNFAQPLVT